MKNLLNKKVVSLISIVFLFAMIGVVSAAECTAVEAQAGLDNAEADQFGANAALEALEADAGDLAGLINDAQERLNALEDCQIEDVTFSRAFVQGLIDTANWYLDVGVANAITVATSDILSADILLATAQSLFNSMDYGLSCGITYVIVPTDFMNLYHYADDDIEAGFTILGWAQDDYDDIIAIIEEAELAECEEP